MCVKAIVDASVVHRVLVSRADDDGDDLFRGWLESGHGILVFTATAKFLGEQRNAKLTALMGDYLRFGRAQRIASAAVAEEEARLEGATRCDDPHVIALARIAGALVLCTDDDDLMADFKDIRLLPRVGRRTRTVYPLGADGRTRRLFLGRRRCPRAAA